jgi:8-hydroxy-5-deazaflavin:NADPH oxidoreductase
LADKQRWEPDLGVLGTGRMGPRLAAMFAQAGRKVVLGSRDPDRAQAIVAKLNIPTLRAGRNADALAAPAVLPAVFIRDGLLNLLEAYCRTLAGKLLIDIGNPFNADYSAFVTPWDSSGAEEIQRRFPQARVVGAFKNVFWEVFDQPDFGGTLSDVLVTGDDAAAKEEFLALAEGTPFRYLDAGPLENSRTVERLTFITGSLGRQLDSYPRMNWRLLTQPSEAAAA